MFAIPACETCHREFRDEKIQFQNGNEVCTSPNVETVEMCRGSCPSSKYTILLEGKQVNMNDCKCCQDTPGRYRNVDVVCTAPSGETRRVTTQVAMDLICDCHECIDNS